MQNKSWIFLQQQFQMRIVTPFAKEILALCEAFGKSGQSGGSVPYTASAISQAVKKLLLREPICDVTGHEKRMG